MVPTDAIYGAAALASYLAGAIPFGWLTGKFVKGIDLRTRGSGNIGATNAAREMGTAWFAPVFALDFLKGFAPTEWLAPWVAATWPCQRGCPALEPMLMVTCGLAAMAGHLYPVYLSFKGGKGVATGAGVVFALSWQAGLAAVGVWILLFLATRYVSLASVVAALALPAAHALFAPDSNARAIYLAVFVGIAAVVVWKHAGNLRRLFRGEEPKVRLGTPKP